MRALMAKMKPLFPASVVSRRFSSALSGSHSKEEEHMKKKKKKMNPILGPDLPDIWNTHASLPPPPPAIPSQNGAICGYSATVIDGKSIAAEIRVKIAEEVRKLKIAIEKVPGLAMILVGNRRDSETYVRFKTMACHEVGMSSFLASLPTDCTDDHVIEAVSSFNDNPSVHGILVQLPLPQHLDEEKILSAISLEKDVDGFHPLNMGNLALRGREPLFIPCASKACIELLLRSGVELMGKKVAMIGRGKVVGLPTSLLLQRHHATVTIIHALTENPESITREADIVISAAGVANLVRGSWLKRGSIVIDVGTNPVEDPDEEHGYRLIGDVCYEEALQVASMVTPVPGGVGPMTVAMLLSSTVDSAKRLHGLE